LKDLRTGHAELVSVLPSISDADELVPTLDDFYAGKKMPGKAKLPGPRQVSCGTYLDYGPYASFAPTFDSEGAEAGWHRLGEAFWRRHQKGKMRERAKILKEKMQMCAAESDMDVDGTVSMQGFPVDTDAQPTTETRAEVSVDASQVQAIPIDPALQEDDAAKETIASLSLPADDTKALQTALDHVVREKAIGELLESNAKALLRLELLQLERLGGEKGGSSVVSENSEEWTTGESLLIICALVTDVNVIQHTLSWIRLLSWHH
jgi:hypothetical protein